MSISLSWLFTSNSCYYGFSSSSKCKSTIAIAAIAATAKVEEITRAATMRAAAVSAAVATRPAGVAVATPAAQLIRSNNKERQQQQQKLLAVPTTTAPKNISSH